MNVCFATCVPRSRGAFTLTEIQITLGLFLLVIGFVVSTQLFGIRLYEYIRPKLDASDQARRTVGRLVEEVRCAAYIKVGKGDTTSFTEAPLNAPQCGNALEIYPEPATNRYVRYFRDGEGLLKRKAVENSGESIVVVARSITNEVIFTAETFSGVVLTNTRNNHVIDVNLQFYQSLFPGLKDKHRTDADYYQLRTKITRRVH